jgi:hypothetical protein
MQTVKLTDSLTLAADAMGAEASETTQKSRVGSIQLHVTISFRCRPIIRRIFRPPALRLF